MLITPAFACIIALMMFPVIRDIVHSVVYDDSPPLIFHSLEIVGDGRINAGGTITTKAIYTKRADCHPPAGSGETEFRVQSDPDPDGRSSIYVFDLKRPTRWTPGSQLTATSTNAIPADIPPGNYVFQQKSTYICRGASRLLEIMAPALRIVVM